MRTLTSPVKLVPWLVAMLSAPVLAAGAHDHGGGRLDVSIEKERITIELELPLMSWSVSSARRATTRSARPWRRPERNSMTGRHFFCQRRQRSVA